MPERFDGFPKDFFRFFTELESNNDRAWFEKNKARYREVVQGTASAFITAIAPRLAKLSKHIRCAPKPVGGSMFRIHRDVRFAKDKEPYKDHCGIHFRVGGKDVHGPGFYLHLAPKDVRMGGGMWRPEPDALARIRIAIDDDPTPWRTILASKPFKKELGELRGEQLARVPKAYEHDHPDGDLLRYKSFFAMHESSPKNAQSASFLDEVDQAYRAASPLVALLASSVGVPF